MIDHCRRARNALTIETDRRAVALRMIRAPDARLGRRTGQLPLSCSGDVAAAEPKRLFPAWRAVVRRHPNAFDNARESHDMAIPQTRQELLDAIRTTYEKLAADLAGVPPERAREATLEGHARGTRMSAADLVAYLIGWNQLVLKWCDASAHGRPVDFPDTGYKWNELGRLAQKFYADHAHDDYPGLLHRFADVHARIVSLVERETDESLYGARWYEKYTLGRMIQFNTSSPYANARARLRKWKKAHGIT
ncbi:MULTISPECIES: ClbS/DfsB family four-helix bundle protein [Burkholderia]|uniref:ClbS/DfsB family four-helix bundle protein n=1 Tax=Burkholderia TaxID=32008 RepID=UPI0022B0F72D|nr:MULTISPECIES: ClbS/DfsB family four-helix bundle protein [Burkholderia]